MNVSCTEQQTMLKQSAREFLQTKCPKSLVRALAADEKGYSPELWREMAELGWTGLVLPSEYGGSGMSFLDLVLLLEEAGRACLPSPMISTVIIGGMSILNMGTEEQKQKLLPGIADGSLIISFASAEPGNITDLASMQTTAKALNDEHYSVNGRKSFVPYGSSADYLLCIAGDGKAGAQKKPVAILVETNARGIEMSALYTFGTERLFDVRFNDVRVPDGSVLLSDGGWLERVEQMASIGRCAELMGCLQVILEMSVDYAKERSQGGHRIGSYQTIQNYCANMLIDVTAVKMMVYQAAWMLSENFSCAREASMTKAWLIQAGKRVAALAHQVHGAIGFTEDYDLQLYTKRIMASSLILGDSNVSYEKIAEGIGL